jgi:uncharacterized protein
MEIGVWNRLRLDRFTSVGAYLEDNEGNDVLLPNKYVEDGFSIGDTVEVFLYRDSLGRLVATTLEPYVQLGEFAYLECVQVSIHGAFLDWGLEKDLLVPFREQPKEMEEGRSYLIYLYLDDATQRLAATARTDQFIEPATDKITKGDKVVMLVCERTDLGTKVIVENKYQGMIFNSDIHRRLRMGDIVDGYVKNVRPDGKLDVALQQEGYGKVEPLAQELLDLLAKNEGFLPINDKSDPEEVQRITGWSKKTFKQVVGNLYKLRLIAINDNGIASKE